MDWRHFVLTVLFFFSATVLGGEVAALILGAHLAGHHLAAPDNGSDLLLIGLNHANIFVGLGALAGLTVTLVVTGLLNDVHLRKRLHMPDLARALRNSGVSCFLIAFPIGILFREPILVFTSVAACALMWTAEDHLFPEPEPLRTRTSNALGRTYTPPRGRRRKP